jgi:hypothetical protein
MAIPRRNTADPPITDQVTGMITRCRGARGTTSRRTPADRIRVGQGTPNVGIRGYPIPNAAPRNG